jgi:hypothetical protein
MTKSPSHWGHKYKRPGPPGWGVGLDAGYLALQKKCCYEIQRSEIQM